MRFGTRLLACSLLALTLSGPARATILDFGLTLFLDGTDITGTNTIAGGFSVDTADARPLSGGSILMFEPPDFQDALLTSGVNREWTWSDPIATLDYRPATNLVAFFDLAGQFANLPPGTPLPGLPFTTTVLEGRLSNASAGPGPNDTTLVGDSFARVVDIFPFPPLQDRITHAVITVTSAAPEPGETPDDPVLPDPGPSSCAPPPWCMSFSSLLVTAGGLGDASPIYIDPPVAIGYEYEILVPGVFFGSVLIPPGNGFVDGDLLELLVGGLPSFELLVGTAFDFVDEGLLDVDFFSIEGIDPALGLAIDDPLAFVTGLTFVGAGGNRLGAATEVQLTMTAIRQDIGATVPEPGTLALLAMGALGFGLARRRSR